jgi:hypothetical protein
LPIVATMLLGFAAICLQVSLKIINHLTLSNLI